MMAPIEEELSRMDPTVSLCVVNSACTPSRFLQHNPDYAAELDPTFSMLEKLIGVDVVKYVLSSYLTLPCMDCRYAFYMRTVVFNELRAKVESRYDRGQDTKWNCVYYRRSDNTSSLIELRISKKYTLEQNQLSMREAIRLGHTYRETDKFIVEMADSDDESDM